MIDHTFEVYRMGLGLGEKGKVVKIDFSGEHKEVHVFIEYVNVNDLNNKDQNYRDLDETRTGRHLDTMQYKTIIHCKVPRVTNANGQVNVIEVPGAKKYSRFTMMFEGFTIQLCHDMPILSVAKHVNEPDKKIGRMIFFGVLKARGYEDFNDVAYIGIDETGFKKYHKYITVVLDTTNKKVICVTNGRYKDAVDEFVSDFVQHNGNCENIQLVTCDMSKTFQSGINTHFKNAQMIIDKFHIFKHMNDAMNVIRVVENKKTHALKNTRFLFLRNESKLSDKQKDWRNEILAINPETNIAYTCKLQLEKIYNECCHIDEARPLFGDLLNMLYRSKSQPLISLADMFSNRLDDILRYFTYRKTNAILEGFNSIIQMCKARARGFKKLEYFKSIIYLVCSKLNYSLAFDKVTPNISLHLK